MTPLTQALDALAAVARDLGVEPHVARREGVDLSATVLEPVQGAVSLTWAQATGSDTTGDRAAANVAFSNAASRARRWRAAPTDVVNHLTLTGAPASRYADALVSVLSATAALGSGNARVADNVARAAASQRAGASLVAAPPAYDPDLSPIADPRIQESLRLLQSLGSGPFGGALDPARPGAVPPPFPTPSTGPTDVGQPGATASGDAAPAVSTAASSPGPAVEPATEPEPEKTVEELLADLDAMIGLSRVKREVHQQVAMLKVEKKRQEAGMRNPDVTRHLVFTGNPGTGKTTVARMVSGIYHALGLLAKGHLVEVDRSELVAGYLGQTAMKTAEVCATSTGGVLFIDEAYSLGGDDYGSEAINTLVKEMEDHRDQLVVIVAGYTEPMDAFLAANPGLSSRFRTVIGFDDYTDDELVAILRKLASAADFDVSHEAEMTFRGILAGTARTQAFGNGRFARNLLEEAIGRHAWRLQDVTDPTVPQLRELLGEDFRSLAGEPEGGARSSEGDPSSSAGPDHTRGTS
ncbi:MAG: AAA family ATPase [Lapillicoccus sp.]